MTSRANLLASILACVLVVSVSAQEAKQDERFTDHGVPVPLAECRGVYGAQDGNGHGLVIVGSLDQSPRGWILVTDIDTGETEQIYTPEGVPNSPPYGSCVASTGKFYTSQGGIFLEFDPPSRQWTFHGRAPGVGAMMTIAEGPDGTIWAGSVYHAGLTSFDPKTKELKDHGSMDAQRYLSYLGFDDAGWVYCGIGTAKCNIIAYHSETGEKRQLIPEDRRKVESGRIWRGADGKLYGTAPLSDATEYYLLHDGAKTLVKKEDLPARAIPRGTKPKLPDGRIVSTFEMLEKYMEIYDPEAGLSRRIAFDYESEGSMIRVLTHGPDGKIYANSSHPSRFISYDPATDELKYYPGGISLKGMDTQGKYVFGGMYTGGSLHVCDTTKPINLKPGPPTITGGIPAAELVKLAETDNGELIYLPDRDALLWKADNYDRKANFKLTAPEDGQYYLYTSYYRAPGYTWLRFYMGDEKITEQFDCKSSTLGLAPVLTSVPLDLKAGEHIFTLRNVKGRHAKHPHLCLKTLLLSQQPPDKVIAEPEEKNPRCVIDHSRPDVNVPWGAFAHPDGKHIIIAGLPGYGRVGGGMDIYNLETGETLKLTHEDLVEYHSTIPMQALPNGDLIAGTTVSGTHGGKAVEKDAVIYVLDWQTKQVKWKTVPMPGMSAIGRMKMGPDGKLYCMGSDSVFFVFDPETREVVHQQSLEEYGGVPVNGMERGTDDSIYIVFSKAIVKITPGTYEVEKLADAPGGISAGIGITGGRIYFAIGSHLWSYKL